MSTPIRRFQDSDTWNAAMDLTVCVYRLVEILPSSERFELSGRMRRAAVSIPSNVAEGHATGKDGLCIRHVRIALGSVGELETQVALGIRLKFFATSDTSTVEEQLSRTRQLLHGLLRSIQRRRVVNAAKSLALLVVASPLLILLLR